MPISSPMRFVILVCAAVLLSPRSISTASTGGADASPSARALRSPPDAMLARTPLPGASVEQPIADRDEVTNIKGDIASTPVSVTDPAGASSSSSVMSTSLSSSQFEMRRIPRSEFAPAHRNSRTSARITSLERDAQHRPQGNARSAWWDELALGFSGNRVVPAQPHRGDEARYGLRATRLLSLGKLELDGQIATRDGDVYIPRGQLKVETFRGWKLRLGDVDVPQGGPACRGLTGRGAGVERSVSDALRSSGLRFGIIGARAPVQYANVIAGRYPRSVLAASAGANISSAQDVTAQAFGITERRPGSDVSWRPIRNGVGVGVATSIRAERSNLSGEFFASRFRFVGGSVETGSDLRLRGRSRVRAVGFGANIETSRGTPYRAGAFGSIQQAPRYVADGDVSLRWRGGWNAGLWGGRWTQIPLTVASGENEFGTPQRSLKNRALRGSQWGSRIGWTIPRVGTGVALSGEWRWRTLSDRSQEIRSGGLSADQRVSRNLRVMLQANRLAETGGRSRNYVTGNFSLSMRSGALLSLQQQTIWQEPLGPQLVSIFEVSSMRLLRNRLMIGASAAQVHQEDAARFLPVQTQGALNGRLALGDGIDLSVQVRFNLSGVDRTESIEIGFTHSFAGHGEADPLAAVDPRLSLRQMLGGIVFDDRNGDGIRQDNEPGVPEIRVVVDNDVRDPVACDTGGRYRTSLAIGRHQLRLLPESIPTAYSLDRIGTTEVDVSSDRPIACDFPLLRLAGAIEGRVIHTDDGSTGPLSQGGGMEHVRVVLDGAQFTYTDAGGSFAFRHLAAGEHEVRLDPEGLPFGFRGDEALVRRVFVAREADSPASCEFRLFRPVQRKVF